MSNREQKNKPCKSLPLEYVLITWDKPMQSPVPEKLEELPPGQAAEPRMNLYSSLLT